MDEPTDNKKFDMEENMYMKILFKGDIIPMDGVPETNFNLGSTQ